ncbi:ATP-binding protein [Thermodesulfobacteriota bacterium]
MRLSIKKSSRKESGLRYKLVLIETLIFVLPVLAIGYIFWKSNFIIELSHVIIIALILILILASMVFIRQIFDKIINITNSIKMAQDGVKRSVEIEEDTSELHEIAGSFNNLMEKFERKTEELKCRAFELFTIKDLTESASKTLDIDELLNLLLEKAMAISKAQTGSVVIVESEKQRFHLAAYRGVERGPQKDSYIKIVDSIARQVVSDKRPLLVQAIETDPRIHKPNGPKYDSPSFLSMSIFVKNNLIAVLNLADKENQEVFNSNDEHILSIMIGEIGFALENAMLHSTIKEHLQNLQERSTELTITNDQLQQEINERKQVENALQKYKQIVSAVQEQILFIDKNYFCQAVNEAYLMAHNKKRQEIIGHSLPEIIGQTMFDEKVKDTIDRCLMGEEVQSQHWYNFPIIGRRFIDIVYSPIFEEDNSVIGTVFAARDFTQTKQLEAQLLHAQKMEAIGTIASGIAHNFNNLLMAIQGNVSLILLGTDANHPNYNMLKNIEKQVQSGSDITRQLLGYTKKGKFEVKPISLNQSIKETSETFGEAKKHISVHIELADDLFGINADQGQIEQTLLNLYLNAADAMPGGGDLCVKTMNVTHKEITNKPYSPVPGKYVFLQVTDTGSGIDKEILKRIFEPFVTTKTMGRGTGLGLASVYGIIKGHGGYIDVESEKHQGTTFNIYLPASDKEVEKQVAAPTQIVKGNETILLVDDEELVIEVVAEMLKNLGYSVLEAKNGNEAVKIYRENKERIDLVIIDMIMPGMDGGKVFDRIKEINKNVKTLLSSGYCFDSQDKSILESGCSDFINKPFNSIALSQSLRTILDNN